MFYDEFSRLCAERGESLSAVSAKLGLSNSAATQWKARGSTPRPQIVNKIADYFGVTPASLLGFAESAPAAPVLSEEEQLLIDTFRSLDVISRVKLLQTAITLGEKKENAV